MMRYLLLNAGFLLVVVVVALRNRTMFAGHKSYVIIAVGLLTLTAVFDNVIIALNIVSYHAQWLTRIYVYRAPIEDFAYTLVGVMLIPVLWERFK